MNDAEFFATLAAVSPWSVSADPEILALCSEGTEAFADLESIDTSSLSGLLSERPEFVRVAAAALGLSNERLKTWLQDRFATAGYVNLAKKRPTELVEALDEDFNLVDQLSAQAAKEWTWADSLAASMASRHTAGRAVQHGRALEDEVEALLASLNLNFVARTSMVGAGSRTAPADFAVPTDGAGAQIAVAVKGFDSTGSKLSDAAREIEEMASSRRPDQFVYAVVDGVGWHRRQSDLRRILALARDNRIAGVYSRATFETFRADLLRAARVHSLL